MLQEQVKCMKLVMSASVEKAKFLLKILTGASKAYDEAIKRDAVTISGALHLSYSTVNQSVFFNEKCIGLGHHRGGVMYTSVYLELRDYERNPNKYNWDNFGASCTQGPIMIEGIQELDEQN